MCAELLTLAGASNSVECMIILRLIYTCTWSTLETPRTIDVSCISMREPTWLARNIGDLSASYKVITLHTRTILWRFSIVVPQQRSLCRNCLPGVQ